MTPDEANRNHTTEHIDLALSGGGFRATLFHLGVIGFLRSQGLLEKIDNICSVSGGSILAAHMVTRWDEYAHKKHEDFENAVMHLIDAIRTRDVTGHTLRRWRSVRRILLLKSLDPELLADEYRRMLLPTGKSERPFLRKVGWVIRTCLRRAKRALRLSSAKTEVEASHSHKRWEDLARDRKRNPNRQFPQLHCLATHLRSGSICLFNEDGFSVYAASNRRNSDTDNVVELEEFAGDLNFMGQDVARAVAASSAFPPIFGPLPAKQPAKKKKKNREHPLTDGGVCDNSGVRHLRALYRKNESWKASRDRLVIISDAGRAFSELSEKYETILNLATRVSDAQGNRIAEFDSRVAETFFEDHLVPVLRCSIHDPLVHYPEKHSSIIQQRLRTIRTELDKFSEEEIYVLYRHGYLIAQQQYGDYCEQWTKMQWEPPATERWLPGGTTVEGKSREDLEEALESSHEMKKLATVRKALYSTMFLVILAAVLIGGPFGITMDRFFFNPPANETYKLDLRLRGDKPQSGDLDYVPYEGSKWPYAYGSGLAYHGQIDGNHEFYMITDRGPAFDGPTSENGQILKLYLRDQFTPHIARVVWNGRGDSPPEVIEAYPLVNKSGFVNGLPPDSSNTEELTSTYDSNKSTYEKKGQDGFGLDTEDLALSPRFAEDNTFWICEEYRPSIMKAILRPSRIVEIQENVLTPGNGLPKEFGKGEPNRRIESIAIQDPWIFVAMQSACPSDASPEPFIRIARAPLAQVNDYVENRRKDEPEWETFKYRVDKYYFETPERGRCSIGGIYAIDENNLLVLEREAGIGKRQRLITKVNLKTEDGFVTPTLWFDLTKNGWDFEKVEGITLIDDYTIAICADNDFGLMVQGEVVLATDTEEKKKIPLYTSDMKLFKTEIDGNTYSINWREPLSKPNPGENKPNGTLAVDNLSLRPQKGIPWQTPFWVIKRSQPIASGK